jgi:hypothetical protein
METRPTFLGLKSDYYTHCHDLPPQLGGALRMLRCLIRLCACWAHLTLLSLLLACKGMHKLSCRTNHILHALEICSCHPVLCMLAPSSDFFCWPNRTGELSRGFWGCPCLR